MPIRNKLQESQKILIQNMSVQYSGRFIAKTLNIPTMTVCRHLKFVMGGKPEKKEKIKNDKYFDWNDYDGSVF